MTFSKSFGYALRGILYVSLLKDEPRKISIDEIAEKLSVPRHFLGKIMKAVVKAGILSSTRGLQGGFFINEKTLGTPLLTIILLTEGNNYFNTCLLSMRKCNSSNPCPLHNKVEEHKDGLLQIYGQTLVSDLLQDDKADFIKSLATVEAA
ncbi:MAG: Rrf2 family transcriptional regulator [Chitinophagales bacterium]|nr:Rrf2 family transcriptional regulator [Chitinophagales bacterium]